jgi:hypothetical protein
MKYETPVLYLALSPSLVMSRYEGQIDPKLVKLLLDHGANPNQDSGNYLGTTIWIRFLKHMRSTLRNLGALDSEKHTWFLVTEMLIRSGANPKGEFFEPDGKTTIPITNLFRQIFPQERASLLEEALRDASMVKRRPPGLPQNLPTRVKETPQVKVEQFTKKREGFFKRLGLSGWK